MTYNSAHSPEPSDDSKSADTSGQSAKRPTVTGTGDSPAGQQSDIASLVLLINSVLGGLGALYVNTQSTTITLVSGAIVLLITIVVLVVKRRGAGGPSRGDGRSGQ
ncbi:hypothetical protein [Streptomyces cellulosae]|uniref:Gram-positive cocci surface proteins LPxTG domain-containing protein n=1 Tax=Streptomyces cellulosae TaxID=1968 RepID=A0ABW7Y3B8_STRCE